MTAKEPLTVDDVIQCAANWMDEYGDGATDRAEWVRLCREAIEAGH